MDENQLKETLENLRETLKGMSCASSDLRGSLRNVMNDIGDLLERSGDEGLLRETLENLHQELEETPAVKGASRDLLREVMEDIGELLERSGEEDISEPKESLTTRLEESTLHFENDHPGIVEAIRRVVDALGRAGI